LIVVVRNSKISYLFFFFFLYFLFSRLALSLPHPVDPDNSQAKWDKEKCSLQVTLKLVREYDDFNF
jgi:hypothetical protein